MKTNQLEKPGKSASRSWEKEKHWQQLVFRTARAARLTAEEELRLEQSLAGEILAAMAFLSGCRNPERAAVTHLTMLVASIRCREIFDHKAGESIRERLDPVNYLPGGNPEVLQVGMLLLEMIALNDHREDLAEDILKAKQNPLIAELDYDEEKKRLSAAWKEQPVHIRELYGELYNKSVLASFWW